MGNELDEVSGPVDPLGRDINVIDKQIKVAIQPGTMIFEKAILFGGVPVAAGIGFATLPTVGAALAFSLLGVLPALIFQWRKVKARAYLQKLQQKVQADASLIDNYLEQRVIILKNLAALLSRSIELDKDVMTSVAALRSGIDPNQTSTAVESATAQLRLTLENYPNLKSQDNIAEAIRQNSYLQKEITAARTLYNDTVTRWNQDIFDWPVKQIVSAREGYTTRIPFTASADTKAAARDTFF